jgi:hypothetical protein
MKLIEAICIESPREVATKYGQRLVIDAIDRTTGEKITLWRPATDDYSRRYVIKNSPLTVGVDSKGKFSLIENEALTNLGKPLPVEPVPVKPAHTYSIPPQSDPNFSPDKKAEMAEYVANLASLYQHCQDKAENIALTPDDARAIGTTLFIQTVKHFNL